MGGGGSTYPSTKCPLRIPLVRVSREGSLERRDDLSQVLRACLRLSWSGLLGFWWWGCDFNGWCRRCWCTRSPAHLSRPRRLHRRCRPSLFTALTPSSRATRFCLRDSWPFFHQVTRTSRAREWRCCLTCLESTNSGKKLPLLLLHFARNFARSPSCLLSGFQCRWAWGPTQRAACPCSREQLRKEWGAAYFWRGHERRGWFRANWQWRGGNCHCFHRGSRQRALKSPSP